MSKSFDISRRRKVSNPPTASAPPSRPSSKRRSSGIWLFLAFVIGAGIVFFSLEMPQKNQSDTSRQPIKGASVKPKNETPKPSIQNLTPPTTPPVTTTEPPKIQVLNGTGITSVTDNVKKILETNSFPIDNSNDAQIEYGQTYIYYRPAYVETAKKIAELLAVYKPSLSESQISGLFDILIIIGKQNLPK